MSLYDSDGVDAYAILHADDSIERFISKRIGIFLNLRHAFFEVGGNHRLVCPANEQPKMRLVRLNVQGYAGDGGRVEKIYAARLVSDTDVTMSAHEAAFGLATMALGHLRQARKDWTLEFAGSMGDAIALKRAWLQGQADPRYLADLYETCDDEVRHLMWTDRGSYTDPISHAIGAVSELAQFCLLMDPREMLGSIVRGLLNVVSAENKVRFLVERDIQLSGWGQIENPTKSTWDVEGVLCRNLLPEAQPSTQA